MSSSVMTCARCFERKDCVYGYDGWYCAECLFLQVADGQAEVVYALDETSCHNCGDITDRMYCSMCAQCEECEELATKCDFHQDEPMCVSCGDFTAETCGACSEAVCEMCDNHIEQFRCGEHRWCPSCGEDEVELLCENCARETWQLTPSLPDVVVSDDGTTTTIGETEVRWS